MTSKTLRKSSVSGYNLTELVENWRTREECDNSASGRTRGWQTNLLGEDVAQPGRRKMTQEKMQSIGNYRSVLGIGLRQ